MINGLCTASILRLCSRRAFHSNVRNAWNFWEGPSAVCEIFLILSLWLSQFFPLPFMLTLFAQNYWPDNLLANWFGIRTLDWITTVQARFAKNHRAMLINKFYSCMNQTGKRTEKSSALQWVCQCQCHLTCRAWIGDICSQRFKWKFPPSPNWRPVPAYLKFFPMLYQRFAIQTNWKCIMICCVEIWPHLTQNGCSLTTAQCWQGFPFRPWNLMNWWISRHPVNALILISANLQSFCVCQTNVDSQNQLKRSSIWFS